MLRAKTSRIAREQQLAAAVARINAIALEERKVIRAIQSATVRTKEQTEVVERSQEYKQVETETKQWHIMPMDVK